MFTGIARSGSNFRLAGLSLGRLAGVGLATSKCSLSHTAVSFQVSLLPLLRDLKGGIDQFRQDLIRPSNGELRKRFAVAFDLWWLPVKTT